MNSLFHKLKQALPHSSSSSPKPSPNTPTPPPKISAPAMPSAHTHAPRVLIIGAGSRGNSYARVLYSSASALVQSVAEPIPSKRRAFVSRWITMTADESRAAPREDASFASWQDWVAYETTRRQREAAGENVLPGVHAVFVCTLDDTHREIIEGIAPLGLHVMCEKPLATNLADCLRIYKALGGPKAKPAQVFGIGHVLRYSPHNMMLRKMVRDENVIGDVLSVEHTEPVGWWHFSHSYVRGNWRKESISAPSLLTKSCHDIDFLLWLLSSPPSTDPHADPHLPSSVSSTGRLSYFKRSRKPALAGNATNCLSCPAESSCKYSARSIYERNGVDRGITGWPVKIVAPDIETIMQEVSVQAGKDDLTRALGEDWDENTPKEERDARGWYGRCVYESDNDVADDQVVTIEWEEEGDGTKGRAAKTASFHMVAFTEKQCDRRGRIYGTEGEIEYDSNMIRVYKFDTRKAETFWPKQEGGGHGGGDAGLARQFMKAVEGVMGGMDVEEAQREYVGCSMEDVIRSHAMVFAAEEARREKRIVSWGEWWDKNVKDI